MKMGGPSLEDYLRQTWSVWSNPAHERLGDPPKDEAEHFIRCPACGGWIDCRDLEGPLPHPPQDQRQ
jgi:hypothetical protein